MVEIDHGNGLTTRYGHLSKILVKDGDTVESGDLVGAVGLYRPLDRPAPALRGAPQRPGASIPMRFLNAGMKLSAYMD